MSPLRRRMLSALAIGSLLLSACAPIPRDPHGTLDAITGGDLRVGASASPGLVSVAGGDVSGPLADIVEGFAASRSAEVEWTIGSEEDLVTALEEGQLDLAIGGMTSQTPWTDRVGVTRGYPELAQEGQHPIVVLVPMGENGLLAALETYLDQELAR